VAIAMGPTDGDVHMVVGILTGTYSSLCDRSRSRSVIDIFCGSGGFVWSLDHDGLMKRSNFGEADEEQNRWIRINRNLRAQTTLK
jgi:hypothetical protein